MEDFTFYNPTTVDFGKDKEKRIGKHLADHCVKKVLLTYGSNRIKRDGLFETVINCLAENGIEYVEFGGIVSNPLLSKVREGIAQARTNKVDAVLSVGGGSVLDSSKAIAAGAKFDGDVWDLFLRTAEIKAALPVFAILTLAATGSEMNPSGVVTNEATKEKFWIASPYTFPVVSIVNPALMRSVTRDYLVYSATDIIAHCIDSYFTAAVQPRFLSRLTEAIINTVIETTETLLANPGDDSARGEFAWASTQALNGLTFSGSSGASYPNHMIEHALSAQFNVPHGAGLSVVIPAWAKWYHRRNTAQFERFAKEIFGVQTAKQGIVALENWFNKIGTPTRLHQLGIKEADLPATIDLVLVNAKQFGIADIYTRDVVTEILNTAL